MPLSRACTYLLFWHSDYGTWMVTPVCRERHSWRPLSPHATAVGAPSWVGSTSIVVPADPTGPDPPPA